MVLTLDIAKQAIDAAERYTEGMGNQCSIAVVDDCGWLVALHKMDDAPIPTVDIARDKAWTAAAFKMPSSDVAKFGNPSQSGFGLNTQNWNDRLTTIAGGLPIRHDDELIGAIGVCGGTPEEDVAVCQAAIAAISAPTSK